MIARIVSGLTRQYLAALSSTASFRLPPIASSAVGAAAVHPSCPSAPFLRLALDQTAQPSCRAYSTALGETIDQELLLQKYKSLVSSGQLQQDSVQEECLAKLAKTCGELRSYTEAAKAFRARLADYQVSPAFMQVAYTKLMSSCCSLA